MSITDQKPRIANVHDIHAPWNGGKDGKYFRCYLCGHKFVIGDQYRLVLSKTCSNFLICKDCDNGDVLQNWLDLNEEWEKLRESKFWHFVIPEEDALKENEREAAHEARDLREELKDIRDRTYHAHLR